MLLSLNQPDLNDRSTKSRLNASVYVEQEVYSGSQEVLGFYGSTNESENQNAQQIKVGKKGVSSLEKQGVMGKESNVKLYERRETRKGGIRWRDMGTEIKQRQDTNQRNAMANNTGQRKQKRKTN